MTSLHPRSISAISFECGDILLMRELTEQCGGSKIFHHGGVGGGGGGGGGGGAALPPVFAYRVSVAGPGFRKGGLMRMCTVAITPPFDAHRCNESGHCSFNVL